MDACLGGWAADHTDGLPRAFACAGVGLGALAADRQAAQVADASVALDALQTLEIHADFAAQIALDDVLAILDGMDDLGELSLGQVLGAHARINFGFGQNDFCIARSKSVNVAQSDVNALVGRNFYTYYSGHIFVK